MVEGESRWPSALSPRRGLSPTEESQTKRVPVPLVLWLLVLALGPGAVAPAGAASLETLRREDFHINVAVLRQVSAVRVLPEVDYAVLDGRGERQLTLAAGEPVRFDAAQVWQPKSPFTIVVDAMGQYEKSLARRGVEQARKRLAMEARVGRVAPGEFEGLRDRPHGALAVCVGNYDTREQALAALDQVAKHYPEARVLRTRDNTLPRARIRLSAVSGETLAALRGPLTLAPVDPKVGADLEATVQVGEIQASHRDWRNGQDGDVICPGALILDADSQHRLVAVNRIHVDTYLRGVVDAEMGHAPLEAMKAQAVASRSIALSHVDSGNFLSPLFDLCATQRSQVYAGMGAATERADQAIRETAGIVMLHDGQVVQAVYSASCGGVTANSEDVWQQPVPYLRARLDTLDAGPVNLTSYNLVSRWMQSSPDVFSNPMESSVIPEGEHWYFRWSKQVSVRTLTQAANRRRQIGQVRDIMVLDRTASGRVRTLKVVGASGELTVSGYANIRAVLDFPASTFFVLSPEYNGSGALTAVELHGAGFGHGVGMCQTGARQMAENAHDFADILRHYYADVMVERL